MLPQNLPLRLPDQPLRLVRVLERAMGAAENGGETAAIIVRRETVALPDGLSGEFALQCEAIAQPDAPWLARAERRVVTTVEGSEGHAAEVWWLGPP